MSKNQRTYVYALRNLSNGSQDYGKPYYGVTSDLNTRINSHLNKLRSGSHVNDLLQAAWNKEDSPVFFHEILHSCSQLRDAEELEKRYIGENDCYNIEFKERPRKVKGKQKSFSLEFVDFEFTSVPFFYSLNHQGKPIFIGYAKDLDSLVKNIVHKEPIDSAAKRVYNDYDNQLSISFIERTASTEIGYWQHRRSMLEVKFEIHQNRELFRVREAS